jgi:glycosyltransferase involved in cell wall biosynthesis
VTDDGSTDKTWDILVGNYQENSRVIADKFEKNRGKIFAFNNSYKHASGDFIAITGADDVCFPGRIKHSYAFLMENQYDLIFGKQLYCDANLYPLNFGQRRFRRKHLTLERIIVDNTCAGPTLFLTRQMAEKCFPIPENLKFEDWWIAFVSILHGNVGHLNAYLTKYRQHSDNDNADIADSQIIPRLKRDFSRHAAYYRCFYEEIAKQSDLENKEKYLKLIRLNDVYRKLFMEDRLFPRLRLFPQLVKNMTPAFPFFAALALIVFGNRIYHIKRSSFYKRFFHYPSEA